MNRSRKKPLVLEPLEGKQLLTTFHAALAHPRVHVAATTQGFSLAGIINSKLTSIQTFTSNNQNYGAFSFTGRTKSMGSISGAFVAAVDSTQQYMSSGLMRFSNRRGSVDLTLSPAPGDKSSYLFKIASGTGAFASASGSGKIQTSGYSKDLSSVSFAVTMNPT